MSIRGISVVETQRDVDTPSSRRGDADKTRSEALVEAIPTEVLGPYTALVALFIAEYEPGDWTEIGRWILYVIGLLLVPIAVFFLWKRDKAAATNRRVPVAGIVAATLAFGAWGLVMPGGPLTYTIDDARTLSVVTGSVSIVIPAIIAMLPLTRKTAK